ncbi:MAG: hypothetical protein FJW88_05895 [Actinobacteria bacterium]|nr:hypothetical protein [Actinomycetota bacterium]
MRSLVSSLIVGLFLLAACSSSDGSDAETQKYVDAMMVSVDTSDFPFTRTEARCLAEQMVDTVGVDTLEEAGITPEDIENDDSELSDLDLSRDEAAELADVIFDGDCINPSDLG